MSLGETWQSVRPAGTGSLSIRAVRRPKADHPARRGELHDRDFQWQAAIETLMLVELSGPTMFGPGLISASRRTG
jgi:hypothetical protein